MSWHHSPLFLISISFFLSLHTSSLVVVFSSRTWTLISLPRILRMYVFLNPAISSLLLFLSHDHHHHHLHASCFFLLVFILFAPEDAPSSSFIFSPAFHLHVRVFNLGSDSIFVIMMMMMIVVPIFVLLCYSSSSSTPTSSLFFCLSLSSITSTSATMIYEWQGLNVFPFPTSLFCCLSLSICLSCLVFLFVLHSIQSLSLNILSPSRVFSSEVWNFLWILSSLPLSLICVPLFSQMPFLEKREANCRFSLQALLLFLDRLHLDWKHLQKQFHRKTTNNWLQSISFHETTSVFPLVLVLSRQW